MKGNGLRWKPEFTVRTYKKITICGKHEVNIKITVSSLNFFKRELNIYSKNNKATRFIMDVDV